MPPYQSSNPSSSKYTCGGCETSVLNWMTGRRKGYRFLLSAPSPCEDTKIQDVNAKRKPDKECTLKTALSFCLMGFPCRQTKQHRHPFPETDHTSMDQGTWGTSTLNDISCFHFEKQGGSSLQAWGVSLAAKHLL